MDRLSIFLTLMTGAILVGGLVTAVLSLGYYSWIHIAVAGAVGLILTWPAAYGISRMIKRQDPGWSSGGEAEKRGDDSKTNFPEV